MNLMRYEQTFIGSFKNFMFCFFLFLFFCLLFIFSLQSPVDMLFVCTSEWVPGEVIAFLFVCFVLLLLLLHEHGYSIVLL